MANLANAEMKCWPSYRHLSEATGQDVKTVEASLRRLRDSGHIVDSGERRGVTGSVIVYELRTPKNGAAIATEAPPNFPVSTPVIGASTEGASTPVFPASTPKFPVKHPQISHEAPPNLGDGTLKEPSRNPKEPKDKSDDISDLLIGVEPQVLADFRALRRQKKAPVTRTAVQRIVVEAGKAGYSMNDALSTCCARGWIGFQADWVAAKQPSSTPLRNGSRHAGFAEMNYAEGVNPDGSLA